MPYSKNEIAASKFIGNYLHTAPDHAVAKSDEAGNTNDSGDNAHLHHDKHTRRAVSHALKKAHKFAFDGTTDYQEAKNKHAAIVSASEPDDEDDVKK